MEVIVNLSNTGAYNDCYYPIISKASDLWSAILEDEAASDIEIDFTFKDAEEMGEHTLGSAGPTEFSFYLVKGINFGIYGKTNTGIMNFNKKFYDLDINTNYYKLFFKVVFHEMAHVIGFGSLWHRPIINFPSFISYINQYYPEFANIQYMNQVLDISDPYKYVGKNALAIWKSSMPGHENDTYIPIENEGGAGSEGSHWDDPKGDNYNDYKGRPFYKEIMTKDIETASNMDNVDYLSYFTLASIEDIGYKVNRWLGAHRFDMIRLGAI